MTLPHYNQHLNYINKQSLTLVDIQRIASDLGRSKAYGNGFVCCCPAHDDHEPSLSISLGMDGQLLVHCFAGCQFENIMKKIKDLGLPLHNENYTGTIRPTKIAPFVQAKNAQQANNLKYAEELWKHAVCPANTPAETYLRARAIQGDIPPTIRFLSKAKHSKNVFYPCMIAAITCWPGNEVVAVHRTFLSSNGKDKAPIEFNKKMLGCVKGGAVRLAYPGPQLIISEGLENGLSIQLETGLPVWAALSASGMQHVIVPPLDITQEITIAGDNDKVGRNASNILGNRLLVDGYKVRIALPPESLDFNDVLRSAK